MVSTLSLRSEMYEQNSVNEIFVSKKEEYSWISRDLQEILEKDLWIKWIKGIKIFNNYLVEWLSEEQFEKSKRTIFSEAPVDNIIDSFEYEKYINWKRSIVLEAKPGQYDNRVDAIEQNLMLQTWSIHNSRFKKVVVVDWNISDEDYQKIINYLVNPVESQSSSLFYDKKFDREISKPVNQRILHWFTKLHTDESLLQFIKNNEFSINLDDVKVILEYFRNEENRDPTMVELMLIDTYWSDHCRHTTFETKIENLEITWKKWLVEEVTKFREYFKEKSKENWKSWDTFMQIAQASFRFLKDDPNFKAKKFIDYSVEDNAASYKTTIELENWKTEEWVIMFKNETHNSPTEVEPFGWAATCLWWAIRDTISWRAFTFQCMRISWSKNPTESISETHAWKLSQRAISIWAALWYASYGNQIWLATGRVQEYFHPWYVAKRFECGYVVAAVKEKNFKREKPKKWDLVIHAGWRIWRDWVWWANVSSQESWWVSSEKAGSHVQKWNPIEERKFQRLLLNPEFTRLVKKSNDFWAGWVSVAIWELSRWIDIDLDIVEKYSKYEWLSDEEIAIAESQERMSFVIDPKDYDKVMAMFEYENLEAYQIAEITDDEDSEEDRLKMKYKWNLPVNLSRSFLDKNWAQRKADAKINLEKVDYFNTLEEDIQMLLDEWKIKEAFIAQLRKLENASQRWLWAWFDNSVWASTILAPYWWKYQSSPQVWMASKIPTFDWVDSLTAIISTNWLNSKLLEENTYIWWIFSIIEAISKIVAMGWDYKKTWVSLQEYFGKLTTDEKYWDVYAGLLWTLKALTELKIAAIWWKDSMSWTATIDWEKKNVPNTIVTFANTPVNSNRIVSSEFKKSGSKVLCFPIEKDENGLPDWELYKETLYYITELIKQWKILSSSTIENWWLVTSIAKLTLWNKIWFDFNHISPIHFRPNIWDIIIEIEPWFEWEIRDLHYEKIWFTTDKKRISFGNESILINQAQSVLEWTLEGVWSTKKKNKWNVIDIEEYTKRKTLKIMDNNIDHLQMDSMEKMQRKPVAIIPIFPWTNSELDSKHALIKAWFETIEHVFYTPKSHKNMWESHNKREFEKAKKSRKEFAKLLWKTDLLFFPWWFSGWDEPDWSAKFIANIIKSEEINNNFQEFLDKESSLTLGICNWFQALVKLWVFEKSKIKSELWSWDTTLTYNDSLRHETDIVRLKVSSILSPFLSEVNSWEEFVVPISHWEWKLIMSEESYLEYLKNWQIPFQYLDENWKPTNKYNWSVNWIAWLTSPDWRILWMMPHPERTWVNVFKNIPWEKLLPLFNSAFKSLTGEYGVEQNVS